MPFDKTKVKNVLVVSLSNIGDVILTFPVIDILRHDFPQAKISVIVGPKASPLLENNPTFSRVFIYDKHQSVFGKIRFVLALKRQGFDFIVDLRNTAIPFFVPTPYRTPFKKTKSRGFHMKEKHLNRLKTVYPFEKFCDKKYCLWVTEEDKKYVKTILDKEIEAHPFIVMAPGAADISKRWPKENFAKVADALVQTNKGKIVFIGSQDDFSVVQDIGRVIKNDFINLCGRLTLVQLSELMNYASAIISNDSAPMHLASYLDKPVLAIFGPTNPLQYGPWSQKSVFVAREKDCLVCKNPKIKQRHDCIESVSVESVLAHMKDIFL